MKTRVTELLGIEQPIIQGAMAWIADARLAAAVSNAGGLGIIACGSAPLSWVREQVELARTLTDKPFGVNIMLMNPEAPQLAELLAELRVPVITTGAGNPGNYIDRWKEAGAKVVPVVASSALAKRMERCGADAVIAEGCEAGGHIGELTTMALTPAVCDAAAIERAEAHWKGMKKKCARLKTAGGFHSPLMTSASEALANYFASSDAPVFNEAEITLICNTDAAPFVVSEAAERLSAQVISPVLFEQGVNYLIDKGENEFVEIGYGGVLFTMMKRISKEVNRVRVGTREQFDEYVSTL